MFQLHYVQCKIDTASVFIKSVVSSKVDSAILDINYGILSSTFEAAFESRKPLTSFL